jgi:hypothetical protein
MRLAGIEKGGYYPYPPHLAEACKRSSASLREGARRGEFEVPTVHHVDRLARR